jgi:cell division protein FtsI (penicillin-binding protein 3)/stage V sporulation protein D (sporulation-specific penicillin-binding protein)
MALMFFIKLYSLQIIHADDFAERADRQYQRPSNSVFNRGNIFFQDRNGTLISAATLKSGFTLTINPKLIQQNKNAEEIYAKLSQHIELDAADFYMRAGKQNDSYEEIRKKVEEPIGEKIEALKLKGVSLFREKWRYYPGDELSSQTLGFLGFKGDEYAGRYGLERYYEGTLKRDTESVYVNFFAEIFSNIKKTVIEGEKLEGDIVTTIEPDTQSYLQETLENIKQKYSSESAGGIIMNPNTGEIYAMALTPTFNPNDLSQEKDAAIFRNDLVESVHEMGSIIKPLTMAVGIDLGKVSATSTYNDTGSVTFNNKTISNFDGKGRGVITLQYAMSKSLNTGFAHITKLVGNDKIAEYFKSFGLGERTGIDLPNEASGIVNNLDTHRDIEIVTASFGQGIAMTPIETARALSVIANGGYLVKPYLVKKIDYRVGYSKETKPEKGKQVIKEDTASAVTNMMVYNVDNSLLDGKAKNPRYAIAAKTGTAQIAAPDGGYYNDRWLHSFVGFLPANDPKFLVFMYTMHPKGVQYASETLAQPFIDMTKYLINYYQIPPDR